MSFRYSNYSEMQKRINTLSTLGVGGYQNFENNWYYSLPDIVENVNS